MQLTDVLCYIVLTITVTASCARAEEHNKEVEESQNGKRITKRETTLFVDINGNPIEKIFQKPKVIYRRISKSRHGPQNTKYESLKPKYRSPRPKNKPRKANRKPGKKRRSGKPKTSTPKYGPPEPKYNHTPYSNKKRVSRNKPKYGVPKFRPNGRPGFGHVFKMPYYSYFVPEKSSFGEPPVHMLDHNKQGYGEPPVDSYGAPLNPSIKDVYNTPHTFLGMSDSTQHNDIHDYKKQDHQSNHKHAQNSDTKFASTKKEPSYSTFVTPIPKDSHENFLDPVEMDKQVQDNKLFSRKKRPFYFEDSKVVNRPWRANKQNEIIVGGQYAEPPARFMPKYHQSLPMYDDGNDDSIPALHGYVDTDNALSTMNSPYLNYKHSNMAFSPQNLNDAFSIIDK